ncbi:tyrosine-protein phosphatase [Pseudomaricurvus alkylphenolicus]|uniref:tyrosine-protein phosphatase n=1 Tax=Pseudomaricurvus alkylphenolicus TaxID=1306991 RepID=UPI00142075D7|nr:tyrosine-protein phosphatase [Pseudomaricurvus alkylphenolicus]NIB42368.1 tyrosine-protein phosphatase [Pseudomaricurvus alkylphenolicus]
MKCKHLPYILFILISSMLFLGCNEGNSPAGSIPESEAAGSKTEDRDRLLPLEGGKNFRDLGGYQTSDGRKVAWDKIYRSGELSGLTDNDYKLLSSRNISTVIDFRTARQRSEALTQWQAGEVDQLNWDYEMHAQKQEMIKLIRSPEVTLEEIDQFMTKFYIDFLKQNSAFYRDMFETLINTSEPVLFHCSSGKDRTGMAAALILTALGVDREQIMEDYMLSAPYLKLAHQKNPEPASDIKPLTDNHLPNGIVEIFLSVREPWMTGTLTWIEQQSGSVMNYIQQDLNVSDADITLLRAKYLEH